MKRKNKIFLKGFLCGIGAMLVIAAVAFVGTGGVSLYLNQFAPVEKANESTQIPEQGGPLSMVSVFTRELLEKEQLLQSIINENYLGEVEIEEIQEGILSGLVEGLNDPYSVYYSKEEYKKIAESITGSFYGIGVTVDNFEDTHYVELLQIIEDSPAEKAGLKAGDVIYKVDGMQITDQSLDEIVALIRGEKGTEVVLTIARQGAGDYMDFSVVRDEVKNITVSSMMLDDKAGYLAISQFTSNTAEEFRTEYEKLQEEGMEQLIIDLRGNPGGLYSSVCEILDGFLSEGLIVYTEDKKGERLEETADSEILYQVPIAVLVNDRSASASEIFAGVVKDREIGIVVGTTTFGKGVVQKTYPLTDGSGLKLTISKYFTPNGIDLNGVGIEPDVIIEYEIPDLSEEEEFTYQDDNQVMGALEALGIAE